MKTISNLNISDIEFSTVMDSAFSGSFAMSPEPHSHAYFEIHAAIRGEYCIETQSGGRITMKPPMLCLIPANRYHRTYAVTDDAQKLALRFTYKQLDRLTDDQPLYSAFDNAIRLVDELKIMSGESVRELMISIRNELISGSNTSALLADLLIKQLYIMLYRLIVPDTCAVNLSRVDDSMNQRYYVIEAFFSDNYSKNVTEVDLASVLNLSKRQTSRILKSIFGMSFRDKLIETRMQKAVKLLEITDISIQQIACSVGYSSPSGFRITFKKFFGMSGEEYRRKLKV